VNAGQSHVLAAASGACPAELLRASRRWSEEDWAVAADGLRSRGWLDGGEALTDAGRAARARIETATDRLAAPPFERLEAGELAHLLATAGRLASAVVAAGGVPFPNPIGLPRPGG
jgi:ADP-heptose:LPS heptosyltransferase